MCGVGGFVLYGFFFLFFFFLLACAEGERDCLLGDSTGTYGTVNAPHLPRLVFFCFVGAREGMDSTRTVPHV